MNTIGIFWGAWDRIVWSPALCIVAIIVMYRIYRLKTGVSLLVASRYQSQFLASISWGKVHVKAVLLCIAFLFLLLVLLEPQWNKKEQTVEQEGRDLFVALDISRSMLAQDCVPNRIACAKKKIKTLLHCLASERVGLILFS